MKENSRVIVRTPAVGRFNCQDLRRFLRKRKSARFAAASCVWSHAEADEGEAGLAVAVKQETAGSVSGLEWAPATLTARSFP